MSTGFPTHSISHFHGKRDQTNMCVPQFDDDDQLLGVPHLKHLLDDGWLLLVHVLASGWKKHEPFAHLLILCYNFSLLLSHIKFHRIQNFALHSNEILFLLTTKSGQIICQQMRQFCAPSWGVYILKLIKQFGQRKDATYRCSAIVSKKNKNKKINRKFRSL